MKQRFAGPIAAAAIGITLCASPAMASSHREAPAIAQDPVADNTDLYAWVSPDKKTLHIVANYIPLEEPAGGPNFYTFGDDVLYEIHITRGAQSLEDVFTYQIRFSTMKPVFVDPAANIGSPIPGAMIGGGKEFFRQLAAAPGGGVPQQTYTVTKISGGTSTVIARDVKVAPPNIGPRTNAVVYAVQYGMNADAGYDDSFTQRFVRALDNGEGKVFAGPRDDGFYADLGAIFDLANLRPKGQAKDNLAGYNVHSIALDLPTGMLTGTDAAPHPCQRTGQNKAASNDRQLLGIWASASRQAERTLRPDGTSDGHGEWVQVSRLGLPLINEALVGLQDKDRWNRNKPKDDVKNFGAYFLYPVVVRDAEAVGIYGMKDGKPALAPAGLRGPRTDIIDLINLTNIPTPGAHAIPLSATGDVLRVDLGLASSFPNGRALPENVISNREGVNVVDAILSFVLTGKLGTVSNNVDSNDKNFPGAFPFLATPWEGFSQGHGVISPGK